MPKQTMPVRARMVIDPMILMSAAPPSIMLRSNEVSKAVRDSQKPTTYIAHATALAKEKISPIEPPNSGPRDLEII